MIFDFGICFFGVVLGVSFCLDLLLVSMMFICLVGLYLVTFILFGMVILFDALLGLIVV